MVELVDTMDLGSFGYLAVQVQVLLPVILVYFVVGWSSGSLSVSCAECRGFESLSHKVRFAHLVELVDTVDLKSIPFRVSVQVRGWVAGMVELVDTVDLGSIGFIAVQVQVLLPVASFV